MKVLKATETHYNSLNGFSNGSSKLEFTKDAQDRWIVGTSVLTDDAFLAIREALSKLRLINYDPIKVND